MNLHDELETLARHAPPGANPDAVLRRARHIKTRRAIGIPAAAVLAVLIIAIPAWKWIRTDGPPATGNPATLTFRVRSATDPQTLERTRQILESRAAALGLGHPHATIRDDRTIVLDTTQPLDTSTLAALSAMGHFELRLALDETAGDATNPMATAPPVAPPTAGPPVSTLDDLVAKLGTAYTAALSLTKPSKFDDARLATFGSLTPAEVALLPASIQFNVSAITCGQLNARPLAAQPADAKVTACGGTIKYWLDRPALTGADVAQTRVVQGQDSNYAVDVSFTPAGRSKLTALTVAAVRGQGCVTGQIAQHCLVAFVLDGRSVFTPEILNPLTGPVQMTDGGTEPAARALAAQIGPRELPVQLELVN